MHRKIVVSCVLDQAPKFQLQVRRFIASLKFVDPDNKLQRVVHHVGRLDGDTQAFLDAAGVEHRRVAAFGEGAAAYCNKLQQIDSLLTTGADSFVLCDADLFFLTSPADLVRDRMVAARRVDKPNPPEHVLRRLLEVAGFGDEPLDDSPFFAPEARTHRLNCNGGLYTMPAKMLECLAPLWRKWATFCLTQGDILGHALHHSDQLGFMFAMLESGLEFAALPDHANFPTHFPPAAYSQVPPYLSSIHYHAHVHSTGELAPVGRDDIDVWIEQANRVLSAERANPC